MLGLQAIPQTEDTLESLSTLLESVFLGRLDKPGVVLDTFNDFWKFAACSEIPSSAWPPKIQEIFKVVETSSGDVQTCSDVTPTQKAPVEAELSTSIPAASGGFVDLTTGNPPVSCPTMPVLLHSPTILCTPKTHKRVNATTPPRPDASPELVRFTLFRSPSTPSKRQSSAKNESPGSPSKKRRVEKENDSPVHNVQSASRSTYTKKRRLSDPEELEDRPLKKARLETRALVPLQLTTGPESDKESMKQPKDVFVLEASPSLNSSSRLFTPSPKKRKAFLLESVEVPSVKQVIRRRRMVEAVRTTKLSEVAADDAPETPMTGNGNEKPSSSPCIPEMLDFGSGMSLSMNPLMQSLITVTVDDSMMSVNDSSPTDESHKLSSDDDPHIGQVTPRHLTSPSLRRGRDSDDPPSDDSNEPASPSRDIILRRLERYRSINQKIVRPMA